MNKVASDDIRAISEFIFVSDSPRKVDAIFLPGGPHPETAEYAAKLYSQGLSKLIIPAGKYGIQLGHFAGVWSKAEIYNKNYQTECEFMTDVLTRCGVPLDAILGEEHSQHTRDNAFFTRKLTDARGIRINSATIICKSFHARRCKMLYQLAYPETEILVCPIDCYGINKDNWYTFEYGIDRVLGELSRCGNQFVDDIKSNLLEREKKI